MLQPVRRSTRSGNPTRPTRASVWRSPATDEASRPKRNTKENTMRKVKLAVIRRDVARILAAGNLDGNGCPGSGMRAMCARTEGRFASALLAEIDAASRKAGRLTVRKETEHALDRTVAYGLEQARAAERIANPKGNLP